MNQTANNLNNESWQIEQLENYFKTAELPTEPIQLSKHTTIMDARRFIQSHLAVVKTNNGNPTFLPFLERLQKLKKILNNNS